MAKNKQQKNKLIQEYKEDLKNSKGIYFVKPIGISAVEATKLKMSLAKVKSNFKIVKNTLFSKALEEVYPDFKLKLDNGEHGIVFSNDDVALSAKEVKEFSKQSKKLDVLSGILDKKLLSQKDVLEIAELPSYEVMLGRVVGAFNAPISSFVRTNNAVIQKFVLTLKAISEKSN